MKTITQSSSTRILGILTLLALLNACGAENTPRATSNASGTGPSLTAPVNTAGDGVAECLPFDSLSTRLSGRVTTYYANGVIQEDKARLRITGIADEFETNPNVYFQIFRTQTFVDTADTSGQTIKMRADTTPLQFSFENSAGQPLHRQGESGRSLFNALNATDLAKLRGANSLNTGSGAIGFFSQSVLVVQGVDYNWQGIKIVLYDGANSSSAVLGQVDFLIPTIQANPNRYMAKHDAILHALHPFYAQRTTTVSETEWANRSRSYCF